VGDRWQSLTVYPGYSIPLPRRIPAAHCEQRRRPASLIRSARGPEDRPYSSPWRSAADEVSMSDKRIETWRSGGFTTVVSSPKAESSGQAAVLDLAGERAGDLV